MSGARAGYDVIVIGGGHNGLVAAAYLGRAGRSASRGSLLPVRALTGAVFGAAVEVAAIIAALALYPSGMGEERQTVRSRLGPPPDGTMPLPAISADSPVLLVHGMSSNRAIFHVLRRGLRQAGFRRVAELDRKSVV